MRRRAHARGTARRPPEAPSGARRRRVRRRPHARRRLLRAGRQSRVAGGEARDTGNGPRHRRGSRRGRQVLVHLVRCMRAEGLRRRRRALHPRTDLNVRRRPGHGAVAAPSLLGTAGAGAAAGRGTRGQQEALRSRCAIVVGTVFGALVGVDAAGAAPIAAVGSATCTVQGALRYAPPLTATSRLTTTSVNAKITCTVGQTGTSRIITGGNFTGTSTAVMTSCSYRNIAEVNAASDGRPGAGRSGRVHCRTRSRHGACRTKCCSRTGASTPA